MSTLMKFELAPYSLQFEAGATYPAKRTHEVLQVRDRTAGGTPQTETLGVTIKERVLNFELMSLNDYEALVDWFLNVVNAGELAFDFTDEYGVTSSVEFVDTEIDFDETSLGSFSGSVTLEYV